MTPHDDKPTIPAPLPSDREIDLERAFQCSWMLVDPGGEVVRQFIRRCHAAEKERDRLKTELADMTCLDCGFVGARLSEGCAVCDALYRMHWERDDERAKVAMLRTALVPFAKWYDVILHGGDTGWDLPYYNDLKRASAVLKEGVTTNEAR